MKMLGKTNQPPCGSHCCGDRDKKHNRSAKRRERQAVRRANAVAMAYAYGGSDAAEWAENYLNEKDN